MSDCLEHVEDLESVDLSGIDSSKLKTVGDFLCEIDPQCITEGLDLSGIDVSKMPQLKNTENGSYYIEHPDGTIEPIGYVSREGGFVGFNDKPEPVTKWWEFWK